MGKFSDLIGRILPGGLRDAPAERQPVRMIEGARNARELCMLPTDSDSVKGFVARHRHLGMGPPRIVQLKADGIRALYIDGRIVTREGTPLDCALHCQPGLARIEKAFGQPLMFDGEYVADEGFNATLSELRAGKGEGVFWAFDVMPLADWQAGRCDMPLERRLGLLHGMVMTYNDSLFVGMLDSWVLDQAQTVAKAREIYAAGGEGVVSKRIGSPYVRDRSEDWLRIKETHTVDGVIVDMAGRNDGTLKHMIVRTEKYGAVTVGTGWDKAEGRTLFDAFKNELILNSMWAEISFQRTTGATRSIRSARFHRIRMAKGTLA